MKKYTVGFVFTPDYLKVLLITKERPDWQKGLLNGIGGKIEEGEEPVACMSREAMEETSMQCTESDWKYFATLKRTSNDAEVHLFACTYSGEIMSTTDEQVAWYAVAHLPANAIQNLSFLIPMGIQKLADPEFTSAQVLYDH